MIFTHSTRLPIILRIGAGLLDRIDLIISRHNLMFPNKLVITTGELYDIYASQIDQVGGDKYLIADNSLSEADKLVKQLENLASDALLLAVGGGQVIDVVKYAATKVRFNYLSVPTALSNDGVYSPVAVLSDGQRRVRTGANIPLGIIVDLSIVTQAPPGTLKSGVGDVISNRSALLDWQLSRDQNGEMINDFAYTLSLMSYRALLGLNPADFGSTDFCSQLAYSLVMSGLAMEIAGDSRPCSGAEHSVSHAIDELFPDRATFHGQQVAAATAMMLRLHNRQDEKLVSFMRSVGLPVGLHELGFNDDEIVKIFHCARQARKRLTIINNCDVNETLIRQLKF